MKHFFVKYEANMLRIIIIMIGYIIYINSTSQSVSDNDSSNYYEIAQKCTFLVKFPGAN